jgi:hypothetical protein
MLIAKINPPAVKSIGVTPFSSTTTNLNYMTAIARPYAPGASSTSFQIQFGTANLNEIDEIIGFRNELDSQLVMTSEELSTWGTNDDTLLNLIASKLGVSVIEIVDVPQGYL